MTTVLSPMAAPSIAIASAGYRQGRAQNTAMNSDRPMVVRDNAGIAGPATAAALMIELNSRPAWRRSASERKNPAGDRAVTPEASPRAPSSSPRNPPRELPAMCGRSPAGVTSRTNSASRSAM